MIIRKCKCEDKVNSQKLAVLKTVFLKKQGSLKNSASEKLVQSKSSFIINW